MKAPTRSLWLLAALSLGAGAAVYAWLRPRQAWLLPADWHAPIDSLWLAPLTGSLPTLLHAFAFVVLTAAVVRPARPRHVLGLGISWLAIETWFECLQHPAAAVDAGVVLLALPFGEGLARFARSGTFDPADIIGAAVGVLLGVAVVLRALSLLERGNGERHA